MTAVDINHLSQMSYITGKYTTFLLVKSLAVFFMQYVCEYIPDWYSFF